MRMWLRELRKNAGLTQEALALRLGVERPVVSQWESGARRPGYDKMLRLAKELGQQVMAEFEAEANGRVA